MHALEISGLIKSYSKTHALRGVDLTIPCGEFFGLLGPNGAGKTTLINSIVGLVRPNAGRVLVMGHDIQKNPMEAKRFIGLSPQEININNYFPIGKIMEFQGGFYGLSIKESKMRAEALLKYFCLWEKRKGGRYQLSGGMQRRLMIARALMGKPKILILDEPTAGIDVELRHELWGFLKGLNADGTTILLTTHYIEEAEILCERVGIISHGKIVACDTPRELIAKHRLPPEAERQDKFKFIRPGSLEEIFVTLTGEKQ
ncbi:MAG: ABC transporter ATP-binding protein [Deltaproteobacteria bacterium]|nr:ABC transporter ATP-binding protein [Deltaproteobacteria bacterium]